MRHITAALLAALIAAVSMNAAEKTAISNNESGWQELKAEKYRSAVFYFKNAVRQNPKYGDALLGLGKAYLALDAHEQAYDLFGRVLKIDPRSVDAVVGTGRALEGMGSYAEALKEFEKASRMSEDNIEARNGMANIYYRMGKKIWAVRALDSILRVDPFNRDALLLKAEIKSAEKRLDEAKKYIEKAIGAHSESPAVHVRYGEILFHQYLLTGDDDHLEDAQRCLADALALQPKGYQANRVMGQLALVQGNYDIAAGHFKAALESVENDAIRYSIAVSHELAAEKNAERREQEKEAALTEYLKAYGESPSDSIIRSRLEDFMVFNDFKFGHPARQMLARDEYSLALDREKKNLADQVIMYLRRTLLLNPMNAEARERLMEYFSVKGLEQFYIDELKELQRLFPDRPYRDRLTVAVIKRRDHLYHREGFSDDEIARDVPGVLVLAFDPEHAVPVHAGAGEVIASHLSFVMGQFGRTRTAGIRPRREVKCGLRCGGERLQDTMKRVEELVEEKKLAPVDYLVYGTFREGSGHISLEFKLMDFKKGFIISEFMLSESGKEALQQLCLRAAGKIYETVPFRGRVLKMKDAGIIVNLGLFDGIDAGDRLIITKFDKSLIGRGKPKRKIVLAVKESDSMLCYAEPLRADDINGIDSTDFVVPAGKKRARMIR